MFDPENAGQQKQFLAWLAEATEADPAGTASMYEVGQAHGLTKDEARRMGEVLIAEEWLEIKTLSGAVGLTEAGQAAAAASGSQPAGPGDAQAWDLAPLLASGGDASGLKLHPLAPGGLADLKALADKLAAAIPGGAAGDELRADLAGLTAQLDSPRPKREVVRELVKSIRLNLTSDPAGDDLIGRVERAISATAPR